MMHDDCTIFQRGQATENSRAGGQEVRRAPPEVRNEEDISPPLLVAGLLEVAVHQRALGVHVLAPDDPHEEHGQHERGPDVHQASDDETSEIDHSTAKESDARRSPRLRRRACETKRKMDTAPMCTGAQMDTHGSRSTGSRAPGRAAGQWDGVWQRDLSS